MGYVRMAGMEKKNYTDVYIAGKVYTLGGFEEEEYLQKLESEGVNVIYPTEEAMEQFREAVADYAAEFSKSLGDDVYAVYEKMIAVE